MKIIVCSCENSGTGIYPDRKLPDLECAVSVMLLSEDPNKLPVFLDRPSDSAGMFEMHFAPSECDILLYGCFVSKPNLVLAGEELDVVDRFIWFDSCISPNGCILDGKSSHVQKP